MDRQSEGKFIKIVDDQTVDCELHDNHDGTVTIHFRPGLILTHGIAAFIDRAYHDSRGPDVCRPRAEDEK